MRDFGQVFDAYAQFEESMINAKMETITEEGLSEEGETSLLHSRFVANDVFLLPRLLPHLFSLVFSFISSPSSLLPCLLPHLFSLVFSPISSPSSLLPPLFSLVQMMLTWS